MTPEELYIRIKESKSVNPNFKGVPLELLQNFHISELILSKYEFKKLNKKQQRSLNLDAFATSCNNFDLKYNIPELISAIPKNINKNLSISGRQIKKIDVESIKGRLSLNNSEVRKLSNLRSVGGGISFYESSDCFFDNLKTVGGNINLLKSGRKSFPKLKIIGGDLESYRTFLSNFDSLVEIGGNLFLREIGNTDFPKLEKVGGHINFDYAGIKDISNLVSVGGGFFGIGYTGIKKLPKLESVGGELDLRAATFHELPALRSVGSILAYSNAYSTNANYWRRYFIQTGRPEIAKKIKE